MQKGRGVDSSAEPDPHGDIRKQMFSDGLSQVTIERGFRFRQIPILVLRVWHLPELFLARVAVLPFQEKTRRQFLNALNEGEGAGHVIESEVMVEGAEIEMARNFGVDENRFYFRTEIEVVADATDIQRFDADAVADENQPALFFVPECSSKHATQTGETLRIPFEESLQNNFGVTLRAEGMTETLQFPA